MKESIITGLSWIKTNVFQLGLIKKSDVKVVKSENSLNDEGD
jgi:hypothetical protein